MTGRFRKEKDLVKWGLKTDVKNVNNHFIEKQCIHKRNWRMKDV